MITVISDLARNFISHRLYESTVLPIPSARDYVRIHDSGIAANMFWGLSLWPLRRPETEA